MSGTQVLNIARREYISRVRNKWFIATTLVVPVFMLMPMFMGSIITRADIDELRLSVLDVDTGQAEAVAARLRSVERFNVEVVDILTPRPGEMDTARESMRAAVMSETIDGYLLLSTDPELGTSGRYHARETGNPVVLSILERAVRAVALENYVAGSGLETTRIEAMLRWDLPTVTVSERGEEEGGFLQAYMSTFILAFVLYITVLMGGQQMGSSIVEEKSSRIIEVVLGAVTATEFMAGKIAGATAAALTQLAAWMSMAAIGGLFVLPALAIGASMEGVDLSTVLDPSLLFYFGVLYLFGYLFWSVLFAVAASLCTTSEEFGQVMFPLMMPLIFSLMFTFYAITNPGTVLTRIASLIPPLTPLVMLARINVLKPPLWEIWLGIGLLVLAIAGAVWLSAKLFRFTLLMQGKRPTFGTVFRLLRAA